MWFCRKASSQSRRCPKARQESQRLRDEMCCGRKWKVASGKNRFQETKIGEPGEKFINISFNANSAMEVETETGHRLKQRSWTISFTPRLLNRHSMRLTSQWQREDLILHWISCLWCPTNNFTECFKIRCKEVANFVPVSRICPHANET